MNEVQQLSGIVRGASCVTEMSLPDKRACALLESASSVMAHTADILSANAADVMLARRSLQSDSFAEIIELDEARLFGVADAINRISAEAHAAPRAAGGKAFGVFCSRNPQNTLIAASLCIMAQSGCVLFVSNDNYSTAKALVGAFREGLRAAGLPSELVALPADVSRAAAADFLSPESGLDALFCLGDKPQFEGIENAQNITDLTGLSPVLALTALCGADSAQ